MTSKIGDVIEEVTKLIEPTSEEQRRVLEISNNLVSLVNKYAEQFSAKVMLGGSVAKGTWLRGEADVDIFVKFPLNLSYEQLEKIGLEVAKKALTGNPIYLKYAEHPYVESNVDGVTVNIVPCYDVKIGEWKTIADRSPYHVEYIKSRLTDELRHEIRLLKTFLKGMDLYGAEIEVEGFSGLVCEILVLYYGSFLQTLRQASEWKWNETIALQPGVEKGPVKTHKIRIADPVDDRRDLGAAISKKQIARLIMAARRFIENPSLLYFKPKEIDPLSILRNSPSLPNLAVAIFSHESKSKDILWGQLKRTLRHLVNQLEEYDFLIHQARVSSDGQETSALLFSFAEKVLPGLTLRRGPDVTMKEASHRFIRENRARALTFWVNEEGRLMALLERRFRSAASLLNDLLTTGKGVAPGLKSTLSAVQIFVGPEVFSAVHKYRWLAVDLAKLCSGEGWL